jgi:hypothetical protein
MGRKLMWAALLGAALVTGGCARRAPKAAPPAPVAPVAPAANATGAAGQPAAPSRANPWKTPAGKLDDEKFIVISAKYTVAGLKLSGEQRQSDEVMRVVLLAILKDAGVTVEQYTAYADEVARDPARKTRVGDAILDLVKQNGGGGARPAAAAAEGDGKGQKEQGTGSGPLDW